MWKNSILSTTATQASPLEAMQELGLFPLNYIPMIFQINMCKSNLTTFQIHKLYTVVWDAFKLIRSFQKNK